MMFKLYNNHNGERKTLTADTSRINKHYRCSNQLASRTQAADASLYSLDMFQQYGMLLRKQIQYFLKGRGVYKTVLSHGILVPQTLAHWREQRQYVILSSFQVWNTYIQIWQFAKVQFLLPRKHLSRYMLLPQKSTWLSSMVSAPNHKRKQRTASSSRLGITTRTIVVTHLFKWSKVKSGDMCIRANFY